MDMDLATLRKLVKSLREDLRWSSASTLDPSSYPGPFARFKHIIDLSQGILPEHKSFLTTSWAAWNQDSRRFRVDAVPILDFLLELLALEEDVESKTRELKIFEGAEGKLKEAGSSFQRADYPSCMNSLNTALELLLKDKLGIPTTISGINTSNVVDVCVKYRVGPWSHFSEAKGRVCLIDNKVKHEAYIPTKIECIDAMKIMEELVSRLRGAHVELSEEAREKILGEV